MTEYELEVVPPCEDCVKESVCAIKAGIATERAKLTMPSWRWLHPRHTSIVMVDCDEYLSEGDVRPAAKRRTSVSATFKRKPKRAPLVVVKDVAPPDPDWKPLCMSDDDYAGWLTHNGRITNKGERAPRPCSDCSVEYAAEMRAVDRCNGSPGVAA